MAVLISNYNQIIPNNLYDSGIFYQTSSFGCTTSTMASKNLQPNYDHATSSKIIYIVGLDRTLMLMVNLDQTVESVKQLISDRTGIPVAQQRLVGKTRSLDSDMSLASCGVENESTLFLLLYIIGGMPRKKQFRYCEAVLVHETYSPDDYDRSYKSYNYDTANSYGGGSTYNGSSSSNTYNSSTYNGSSSTYNGSSSSSTYNGSSSSNTYNSSSSSNTYNSSSSGGYGYGNTPNAGTYSYSESSGYSSSYGGSSGYSSTYGGSSSYGSSGGYKY